MSNGGGEEKAMHSDVSVDVVAVPSDHYLWVQQLVADLGRHLREAAGA